MSTSAPLIPDAVIGIVMGSSSDWETLKAAADILTDFGIAFDEKLVGYHWLKTLHKSQAGVLRA